VKYLPIFPKEALPQEQPAEADAAALLEREPVLENVGD